MAATVVKPIHPIPLIQGAQGGLLVAWDSAAHTTAAGGVAGTAGAAAGLLVLVLPMAALVAVEVRT